MFLPQRIWRQVFPAGRCRYQHFRGWECQTWEHGVRWGNGAKTPTFIRCSKRVKRSRTVTLSGPWKKQMQVFCRGKGPSRRPLGFFCSQTRAHTQRLKVRRVINHQEWKSAGATHKKTGSLKGSDAGTTHSLECRLQESRQFYTFWVLLNPQLL